MTCKCSLRRCSSSSWPPVGGSGRTEGKSLEFFCSAPPPQWKLLLAPIGSGFSYQQLPLAEHRERCPGSPLKFVLARGRPQRMACTCSSVHRWRLVWRWIDQLAFGLTPPPSLCWNCDGGGVGGVVGMGGLWLQVWGKGERLYDDLVVGSVFWRNVLAVKLAHRLCLFCPLEKVAMISNREQVRITNNGRYVQVVRLIIMLLLFVIFLLYIYIFK